MIMETKKLDLAEDETIIFNIFEKEIELLRIELDKKTGFNKSETLRIINSLIDKNIIEKLGRGLRGTYRLK